MYDGQLGREGGEEGGQQARRSAGHSTAITGHVLNVLAEQPKKWAEYKKNILSGVSVSPLRSGAMIKVSQGRCYLQPANFP